MEDIRIILAGLWIALMLTYLLGDVMRIFAGDFTPGKVEGTKFTQPMLMVMALLMLIPIVMIVLSLTLSYPLIGWVSIVAAGFLFIFNIFTSVSFIVFCNKLHFKNISKNLFLQNT